LGTKNDDWAGRASLILHASMASNSAAGILASENTVIQMLLDDANEMRDVWMSIGKKLNDDRHFQRVIELIVTVAAFYSPVKTKGAREAIRHAVDLNEEISKKAEELAHLLDQQFLLKESNSIELRVSNDPIECMNQWAEAFSRARSSYLFDCHVAPALNDLRCKYGLKYWPTVSDLLRGLSHAANEAYAKSYDPLVLAALSSRESSNIDFVRALLVSVEEDKKYYGFPGGFNFSSKQLTVLTNCALGLIEDAYNEGAMKKAVQRIRKE